MAILFVRYFLHGPHVDNVAVQPLSFVNIRFVLLICARGKWSLKITIADHLCSYSFWILLSKTFRALDNMQ